MASNLFEAFFWIEPRQIEGNNEFTEKKVLWYYPNDVSSLTKDFKSIPQFCFPDIEKIKLKKAENSKGEHFTFTLTDGKGNRLYGVCFRQLFRGIGSRHDVGRRPPHCLCLITKHQFFSTFRAVLEELHSIALMEQVYHQRPTNCIGFLESLYKQSVNIINSINPSSSLTLIKKDLSFLIKDFTVHLPRNGTIVYNEVPILPLFELLGIDKFFKLISAVLCDMRIIFKAKELDTLTSSVLAIASILHPFSWPHVFIPLLPSHPSFLEMLGMPTPYIIGVRKYALKDIRKELLQETLVVDADSGEMISYGVHIIDFVGDSGNALKLASESFDRVRARATEFASSFFSKPGNEPIHSTAALNNANTIEGPRDILATVINDLKSNVLNVKPGSSASLQSVASGILRGLPGSGKTFEEVKKMWEFESEKNIRECLIHMFVYLFADLDEFYRPAAYTMYLERQQKGDKHMQHSQPEKSRHQEMFREGDSRSCFDLAAFIHRRNQMGDSKVLVDFLKFFFNCQMFERYCADRAFKLSQPTASSLSSRRGSHSTQPTATSKQFNGFTRFNSSEVSTNGFNLPDSADPEEDLFHATCDELRLRQQTVTVTSSKQALLNRTTSTVQGDSASGKIFSNSFHSWTLQYTSTVLQYSDVDPVLESSHSGEVSPSSLSDFGSSPVSLQNYLDKIHIDAGRTDTFLKIMRTIEYRLETCLVGNSRGFSGASGLRTLSLLKSLLINGPEAVLSHSFDLIPLLRSLINLRTNSNAVSSVPSTAVQGPSVQGALDFMSLGPLINTSPHAALVLSLIIDQNKLAAQQRHEVYRRENFGASKNPIQPLSSSSLKLNCLTIPDGKKLGSFYSKQFPTFEKLHDFCNTLRFKSFNRANMVHNKIARGSFAKNDEDDDDEGGVVNYKSEIFSSDGFASTAQSHPVAAPLIDTFDAFEATSGFTSPPITATAISSDQTPVIDAFSSDPFAVIPTSGNDIDIFRIVNKDTGHVSDSRLFAKAPATTMMINEKKVTGVLLPPPPAVISNAVPRPIKVTNDGNSKSSSDPFNQPIKDPWTSSTTNTLTTDPFGTGSVPLIPAPSSKDLVFFPTSAVPLATRSNPSNPDNFQPTKAVNTMQNRNMNIPYQYNNPMGNINAQPVIGRPTGQGPINQNFNRSMIENNNALRAIGSQGAMKQETDPFSDLSPFQKK